jgi:hypothetical protein
MTFAATEAFSDIDIYQFLKIYQMNGFTRQVSEASEMWGYLKQLKEMDPQARQVNFLLIDELGYGAVQALPADGSGAYPAAQRSNLLEPVATYKEWGWTVDVPRVLESKTGSELIQYAKPLATELDNKQIAFARLKCIELQGDGSGCIGKLSAAASASGGNLLITVSHDTADAGRSFARWFQEGDIVKIAAPASTARLGAVSGGNYISEFKVEDVNEDTRVITLSGLTATTGTDLTITGAGTVASGDYVYRRGTTPQDLTDIGTNDYNTLTEVMVGLETLTANDGRGLFGLTMTGSTKGTRKDLSGAVIDNKHFQQILSELKRKTGKRYMYDSAFMADETYDSIIEARETDRRFHSIEDTDRGVKGIGYVHGRDRVEFVPDEFVHAQRVWILPKGKDALCYIGKDPVQVAPNGNDPFRLSIDSSTTRYARTMETSFEQSGVVLSKFPRALGVIEDFTVSS